MGLITQDTFNDYAATVPELHMPELGGPWNRHPNTTAFTRTYDIRSGRLRLIGTSGTGIVVARPGPASANYTVRATIDVLTDINDFPGVVARCLDGSSDNTMYVARLNLSSNLVELIQIIAGVATTFSAALTITAGS